jgi:putative metal-binding protein
VDEGFPDSDRDGYNACQDCDDTSEFIHPFAFELCDGVDNNCNNVVDDRDYDLDGHGACFGDCSDFDPAVWGMPFEVPSLDLTSENPLSWSWLDEAPSVGPSVVYDVPSGTLGPGTGVIFPSGSCLGTVSSPGFTDARPDPAPGNAYWFLVRARNSCGPGSYGLDGQGNERSELSCP